MFSFSLGDTPIVVYNCPFYPALNIIIKYNIIIGKYISGAVI